MKKYLLLLIASLSLTAAYGQTNIYHPFPDSNAVWIYKQVTCQNPSSNPPCIFSMDYHIYYYILKGDTIVNSTTYHKLYKIDSSAIANSGNFMIGIREDSTKKIYITNFSNPETLLYDFSSTNIGDTIVYGFLWSPCYGTVTSIDSIQMDNGIWRKAYKTNACDWPSQVSYVIEGIGSNYDLLQGPIGEEYQMWDIRCFHQDSSLVYIYDTSSAASCHMNYAHLGIIEQTHSVSLTISPNPFSQRTTLQTAKPLQNASLTVYNSVGQTVKRVDNLSGQTVLFLRDNLPSGLYFVRITQDGNTISADKFVIADK